jgi:hypothetical protein
MLGAILAYQHLHGPCRIVDVGAGPGKWARILATVGLRADAVEIWQPYVERYSLPDLYDHVHVIDARNVDFWGSYGIVILGDVLEHMPKADAERLVFRIIHSEYDAAIFLSIPTTDCPQAGEPFGNPYEAHVAQWTHEELIATGFAELHRGPVPSGLATVGTYCAFSRSWD